uniref:SUEL-type lectin domain-containing protein n=1 Tax=Panagrellus redivivus TaxID=6233 RepID=A0A7E4W1C3_PANRE
MLLYSLLATIIVAATQAQHSSFSVKPEIIEALMIESLRHNLVQACDGEKITLHCPRNTHILIENVFYGRLVPSKDLCPSPSANPLTEDTSCVVSQAHSKITDLCRNKRKCRVLVKSSFFDSDPCSATSKYLQISYKCKPISFEDQNFCEGSQMQLSCKQNKRLSVYSANYGRLASGHSMQCPSHPAFDEKQKVYQDCVSDVLPQVLQKCHAQTDCTIDVEDKFLGSPCPQGVRKYLSLIFMCVNDEVFSEAAVKGNLESMRELERELESQAPKKPTADRMAKDEPPSLFRPPSVHLGARLPSDGGLESVAVADSAFVPADNGFDAVPGYGDESIRVAPASEEDFDDDRLPNAVGFANDVLTITDYIKENKEKALLYFLLSVASGVALLLCACIYQQIKRSKAPRQRQIPAMKSPELNSLIGGSSANTSPMFFDSDTHSRLGLDMGEGHYMRFSHVTPPRAPPSLHYYT